MLIYTGGSKYDRYVGCAVVCADLQFLINTVSEVSVLSSKQDEKNSFDFYCRNDSKIKTYITKRLVLNVSVAKKYIWNF